MRSEPRASAARRVCSRCSWAAGARERNVDSGAEAPERRRFDAHLAPARRVSWCTPARASEWRAEGGVSAGDAPFSQVHRASRVYRAAAAGVQCSASCVKAADDLKYQPERHPELTTGTGCQLFHPYTRVQTLDLHSAERWHGPGRRLRKKAVTRSGPVTHSGRETGGQSIERVPTLHFPQAGACSECADVVPAPHEAGMRGRLSRC